MKLCVQFCNLIHWHLGTFATLVHWHLGTFVVVRRWGSVFYRSEGVLAPGTAYVIPARVGVWLVGGCPLGSDVRLRFVAAAPLVSWGRCFSGYASGGGDHADAFS